MNNEMHKEPYWFSECRKGYAECLKLGDGVSIDHFWFNLGHVLRTLLDFVYTSYMFNSNPLPILRKNFPEFIFRYYRQLEDRYVIGVINASDYVFNLGTNNHLVAIRQKETLREPYRFCIDKHMSLEMLTQGNRTSTWSKGFIKAASAKVIALVGEKTKSGIQEF